MNHSEYIGGSLREFVEALPSYAVGYYEVFYKGGMYYLKDILDREDILSSTIRNFDGMFSDHTYRIRLK